MCRSVFGSPAPFSLLLPAILFAAVGAATAAAESPPAIERVEIRPPGRALLVNGRPFFPLMAWLQDAENFAALKDCGMNATAGYWPGSSGTKSVAEYLTLVEQAGLYGIMPFDEQLAGRPGLLAYIHDDEPDLPRQVSDAEVVPAEHLRINRSTPLWRIVDGVTHSWSVLDPLEGASITVRRAEPVTVESLAVWLTVSPGLAVAREATFAGDGKELLRVTLENRRGQQKFALPRPATFRELTFTVHSVYPGDHVWGSLSELEGFDADGANVLLAPPRYEPRTSPEETLAAYRKMKAADPSRPVLLTVTGNFHPHFDRFSEETRRALYPRYIAATDVVGYDIYPIYGWNRPDWIHLVYEATVQLAELARPRPVYAWIETSKGGQHTGALERQHDVKPEHIRAEVWMSICGGATAIGYFTHVWKPSYSQFGVPEENRRALREINAQITRLAPAILGEPASRETSIAGDPPARLALLAREHEGWLYLFAVNCDERNVETAATIAVEGLAAGTAVEVIDEGRSLRAADGALTDRFAPLAVHLYRVRLAAGE